MSMINRREVMWSAGVAAAAPFALAGLPVEAFSQTVQPSSHTPNRHSKDLLEYANNGVNQLVNAAASGALTQSHFQIAAATTALVKRHLESLNIYQQFASGVEPLNYQDYQTAASNAGGHDVVATNDEFDKVKSRLLAGGLAGLYGSCADTYTTAVAVLPEASVKPTAWDPNRKPHLDYGMSYRKPSLRPVCAPTAQQKADFCHATNWTFLSFATTAILVGLICVANAPEGDFICIGISASIQLHGSALKAIQMLMGC